MKEKNLYECAAAFLILPQRAENKKDDNKKEKIRKAEPTYCGMTFCDYCEAKAQQRNYP